MRDHDELDRILLRKVARQTMISTWLSGCCMALLVFMLFFPQQATWIAESSIEFQEWLAPLMTGILGFLLALAFIVPTAAYILSRVSPKAPSETEKVEKTQNV